MNSLLPCPFCGSPMAFIDDGGGEPPVRLYVECRKCNARTDGRADQDVAVSLWNTRDGLTPGLAETLRRQKGAA